MATVKIGSAILDPSLTIVPGVISAPRFPKGISAALGKYKVSSQMSGASAHHMDIIGGVPTTIGFWSASTPSLLGYFKVGPITSATPRVASPRRSRELHFRQTHRDFFNSVIGQWVCLEGETVVAHGSDIARVVEEARKEGIQVPYIFRVSKEPEGSVRMGL